MDIDDSRLRDRSSQIRQAREQLRRGTRPDLKATILDALKQARLYAQAAAAAQVQLEEFGAEVTSWRGGQYDLHLREVGEARAENISAVKALLVLEELWQQLNTAS